MEYLRNLQKQSLFKGFLETHFFYKNITQYKVMIFSILINCFIKCFVNQAMSQVLEVFFFLIKPIYVVGLQDVHNSILFKFQTA